MEWHGDIDLDDGECENLHKVYMERLKEVTDTASDVFTDATKQATLLSLLKQHNLLKDDLQFIHNSK